MYVYDDLPEPAQKQVRDDIAKFVHHVVAHKYILTDAQGRPTPHGNLTPVVASIGVPFNGQVAYLLLALANHIPADNEQVRARFAEQYHRLRYKRHSYYKDPRKSPIRPQRVGSNPLVKGMNDRNHVTAAAFVGLELERDQARRQGRKVEPWFFFRLARTMVWSMRRIGQERNALCNFMYAAIVSDSEGHSLTVKREEQGEGKAQIRRGLLDGVEQLRRFRLDRFQYPGNHTETKQIPMGRRPGSRRLPLEGESPRPLRADRSGNECPLECDRLSVRLLAHAALPTRRTPGASGEATGRARQIVCRVHAMHHVDRRLQNGAFACTLQSWIYKPEAQASG